MRDDILTPDNANLGGRLKTAYRKATVAPGKYWDYDKQRYKESISYPSFHILKPVNCGFGCATGAVRFLALSS